MYFLTTVVTRLPKEPMHPTQEKRGVAQECHSVCAMGSRASCPSRLLCTVALSAKYLSSTGNPQPHGLTQGALPVTTAETIPSLTWIPQGWTRTAAGQHHGGAPDLHCTHPLGAC